MGYVDRQDCGGDRIDQRHRIGLCARLRRRRRQHRAQRHGTPADIEKERSAIESDFKVKAVHSPADMTKPSEIAGMIALGESTFGSVDVLVNNAGIQFVVPIEEFPVDKWDAIIAINLSSRSTASAPRCPA